MRSKTLLSLGTLIALMVTLDAPAYAQDPSVDGSKGAATSDDDDDDDDDDEKEKAAKAPPVAVVDYNRPWDIYDVEELPEKYYFFVGLRYRGNIVPSFMLNMFVDEGKTVYTNMIGAEFDLRKNGFSLIPALSYHELGTGDILFKQKNSSNIAGNYSLVNSGLKLLYASVDLLWSTKISRNVEFEYGAGFGLGAVFGTLENSWVSEDPNGPLTASTGRRYSRCNAVGPPGSGCNRADHQNSDVDKVGGYKENSWFNGGSKPVIFPWISVPQIGLRFKPIKQLVTRLGVGFSLTGFWFGLSAQYGLEKRRE